jgi:heme exporter protein A
MMELKAHNLSKNFNERIVFKNINFELSSGNSLAITGHNGSGKTTLVKIISGLISPSKGRIDFKNRSTKIARNEIHNFIGLVGPYIQLYNSLSAWENLIFFSRMRGIKPDKEKIKDWMNKVGLRGRELDDVKSYSSGMMQRLKYVTALLHKPEILIVDEPTSNLDEAGCQIIYDILEKQKKGKILIVATNESEESQFGEQVINLTSE